MYTGGWLVQDRLSFFSLLYGMPAPSSESQPGMARQHLQTFERGLSQCTKQGGSDLAKSEDYTLCNPATGPLLNNHRDFIYTLVCFIDHSTTTTKKIDER